MHKRVNNVQYEGMIAVLQSASTSRDGEGACTLVLSEWSEDARFEFKNFQQE